MLKIKLHLDNWFCANRRERQQQEKKDLTSFSHSSSIVIFVFFIQYWYIQADQMIQFTERTRTSEHEDEQ